ncbi:MAG: DDE-type integrase/transposase/recombinase [Azoarcus sp.]|jgi:transposase InsO family protein|nr:DDE-type integrase/transposase/recombinase [Azoarcus sp.]
MMPNEIVTPAQHVRLGRLAERLESARCGEKGALVEAAASELGVTMQTVYRWLSTGHRARDRKRRADAGEISLTRDEAMLISLALIHGISALGKERVTLERAVTWLRDNRLIRAERTCRETGEIFPLSLSAIARALRTYRLDAASLATPAPHQTLSSPHPNWCWQVDASVCVVFYLPTGQSSGGLSLIDEKKVYKNRPENARAIELFRVIRYVMTDHFSGAIRWRYYPHAESGEATCDFLAWAMAKKPACGGSFHADPMHGLPHIVMVDPGATASGKVKRFCRRLGIRLIVNAPNNPRAKGQVEQGQNLIEKVFEAGLLHVRHRVRDFADLNALAEKFQIHFNATAIHTRTGVSRFAAWMRITPAQLIETAPYARLRTLITGNPETPRVERGLTVRFDGRVWNVRHVPEVTVGEKLPVCASPFVGEGVCAIRVGEGGREALFPLAEVLTGAGGFAANAVTIGEEYEAMPETVIEKNKKQLSLLATGAKTLREAAAQTRRKTFQPFGEALNPYKAAEEAPALAWAPRATTPMPEALPELSPRIVPTVRAARLLRDALGEAWRPETYDWLARKYPDGLPEDELMRLIGSSGQPAAGAARRAAGDGR